MAGYKNIKTWVMYKNMNKGKKSEENSSPLHQMYTSTVIFKNISLKLKHHIGGKLFIHGLKHCQGNLLLSLKHLCWLSIIQCVNLI